MASIFLEGSFAPVREERTDTDLPVTGRIPDFLDGRYLRNGPNPASDVDPGTYHWFTGDGMVHGVRLRDGKAEWYRNRWVRSPAATAQLGETFTGRRSPFPMPDFGANTTVIGHAGKILALVEAGAAGWELSPDDLSTTGPCDFDGTITGGYTAHPKTDPATGELHAVSYYFGRGNKVQYSVIDTSGKARRTVDIAVHGSPMMHDFSLTEKHAVFYDLPVTFDAAQAVERVPVPGWLRAPARLVMSALVGRVPMPAPPAGDARTATNGRLPYRWNPRYPARVGVMPRGGGNADVRWFEIEPCYVFHPLNAYDDGDTIVLDVVRYDRMFDRDLQGPTESAPLLQRWTVDLTSGKVRQDQLDDRLQEFPRVDDRLTGRRHRYGYAARFSEGLAGSSEILKHDLDRGSTQAVSFGDGTEPGEFTFVPRAADSAEDDGVLMGFVYSRETGRSSLEILDAATLEKTASVRLPVRVPHGFHGNWIPSDR